MSTDNFTNAEYAGLGGRALARQGGTPTPGRTVTVSCTTASACSAALTPDMHYLLVSDTAGVYVRMGLTNATAAALDVDMYIPPNVPTLVHLGADDANAPYLYIAAITRTGTSRLHITPMKP